MIEYEAVQPAEGRLDLGKELVHSRLLTQVSPAEKGAPPHRPNGMSHLLRVSAPPVVGDRDVGSGPGTEQRGRPPDAARAASDQYPFASE